MDDGVRRVLTRLRRLGAHRRHELVPPKKAIEPVDLAASRSTYKQRKRKRRTGGSYGKAAHNTAEPDINRGSGPHRSRLGHSVRETGLTPRLVDDQPPRSYREDSPSVTSLSGPSRLASFARPCRPHPLP